MFAEPCTGKKNSHTHVHTYIHRYTKSMDNRNPSITGLLFYTGFLMLFLKSKLSTNPEIIFSCTEWEQLYDQMVYGW